MFSTYILFSARLQKFYSGSTENLPQRLTNHNAGMSKFTSSGVPWKIIWHKEFKTRGEAMVLERKIKKRGAERFLKDIGVDTRF